MISNIAFAGGIGIAGFFFASSVLKEGGTLNTVRIDLAFGFFIFWLF